jgi:hypothetical protein
MKPLLLASAIAFSSIFAVPYSYSADNTANFSAVSEWLIATMRTKFYHPAELDNNEAFKRIEEAVIELGENASSADEFLTGFNDLWRGGPFSHVRLMRGVPVAVSNTPSNVQRAGDDPVMLAWEGSTAILTVDTMSGTSEKIDAAYDEIVAAGAQKLIIDLRRNSGGAFGVLPLVGHLISEPIDAGVFVTNQWYEDHDGPPGMADFPSATPCICTDEGFLPDMQTRALTSYRIDPMQPLFEGPVIVLTSAVSISAAEIAADALLATGRATLIGEKTLGLLLQPQRFEGPGGFVLRWPIGDYLSVKNGRIEGNGVSPDIVVDADQALKVARGL